MFSPSFSCFALNQHATSEQPRKVSVIVSHLPALGEVKVTDFGQTAEVGQWALFTESCEVNRHLSVCRIQSGPSRLRRRGKDNLISGLTGRPRRREVGQSAASDLEALSNHADTIV
ncbi:hypothetical protein EVAR_60835_1 [Eumeta japonica]|uniref:Uncharacterized protein n=1 Tax=Eumeta variegata TaxID=151549 RepID=A0A4C1Y713_EUMVA|nr:hypothetical protein EVAR_60835_1 [Eumeta japonica]